MAAPTGKCIDCQYFLTIIQTTDYGECHYLPPNFGPTQRSTVASSWPLVPNEGWCGQYKMVVPTPLVEPEPQT